MVDLRGCRHIVVAFRPRLFLPGGWFHSGPRRQGCADAAPESRAPLTAAGRCKSLRQGGKAKIKSLLRLRQKSRTRRPEERRSATRSTHSIPPGGTFHCTTCGKLNPACRD